MAVAGVSLTPLLTTVPTDTGTLTLTRKSRSEHTTKHSSGIGSFKPFKKMNEAKQLHAQITKKGLNHSHSNLTKLIALCAEMGTSESLDYARKVFDLMEEDGNFKISLFMFNSLIRCYSASGIGNEAFLLYVKMVAGGIKPDHYTFPFVLSACAKMTGFLEGAQLHASAVKMGFEEDMFIQNSLIHFYSECGELSFGQKVFDEMSERNVVSWTGLICGYARRDKPREAVSLFFEMVTSGVEPNSVTMVSAISACAKLKDLDLGERVYSYIGDPELKLNTVLVNALVDMYMKCGAADRAKRLFDQCVGKNLVLYNTILSNYVRQGMERDALAILAEMLLQELKPDRVTMLSVVSASAQLHDASLGRQCHGYILRNGLEGWENISNAMIDMYTKCGKQELACRVFDQLPTKTVVSWNSLIAGFIRNGDIEKGFHLFKKMKETDLVSWNTIIDGLVQESLFEDAIEVFREMQNEGIKPDKVTMVSVASACGYLGALELARWTYRYIENNNIFVDTRLGTALVDMFAKCGDTKTAMLMFDNIKEKDVSAWTSAIGAMALEGNGHRAIDLFHEMLNSGLKPDGVVFVELLTACSHAGLVDHGMDVFQSMKEKHHISPQIVHFGCVVDLLGRAGRIREAFDVINAMPMQPNSVIWGALLAACRTHKDDEMATYAAEKIAESAQERSGTHVLLSNVYASAGKWTDVARIRLEMKEKGICKVPGSSSIEVNGVIHEFTSTDESHPENIQIGKMLDEMRGRIREAGHLPDLRNVLLDVDVAEKDYLLSRHSEKLAITYGLLSMKEGTPIRVIKNLRMCSDCHSFAKLVSEVYDREIVVRDNNRFHSFREGLCSCNDFW